MKPPEKLEGIMCEECGKICDHSFEGGTSSLPDDGVVSWNGIKCTSCQHITIAWAENNSVRALFDQWEAKRDSFEFETEFRAESLALIIATQEELTG